MNKVWIRHSVQDSFWVFPGNIKSIHIPRCCWELPFFPFIDVFFHQCSRKCLLPRENRQRRAPVQGCWIQKRYLLHNCKYIQTFHYITHLLIICCESHRALVQESHSLVIKHQSHETDTKRFCVLLKCLSCTTGRRISQTWARSSLFTTSFQM